MTDTSMPCNVPGWEFDPMIQEPTFNLEPEVAGDEELWYRSQFDMQSFDVHPWQPVEVNQAYGFATPAAAKTPYQQMSLSPIQTGRAFSSRPEKLSPRFENPQADNSPYSLDDLLRTASQLATERALYMNIPPASATTANPLSPIAEQGISSPSASSSHQSIASDTDEHDVPAFEVPQVYQLPEAGNSNANAPVYLASHDVKETNLTPLEMPDGSTRFTANWLPVDPQGGFTIRSPSRHPMGVNLDPELMDYQAPLHQDHGRSHYNYRNAFISLENLGNESGV
ncbi:uncharacterized protein DSM5745_08198 [Aspergillus mulundensis]|uniref:Uncharacterized protein n=1 Tax=Aspergillus mulundensis TaxID=1810919 RepID=A0A3D8R9G5_9EURO|nr:Uncharacterized protein DSM5745_08198 [Aspergillus mulundensis]RDW70687.1 Uncharacterized protein DSM5745_08198 [Aspergillus mulundensis]